MNHSILTDTRLNNCHFIESDLRNIEYSRYPDFIGHRSSVNSITFSPNGKYLASGSDDNTVKLWSMESQNEIITLQGHRGWVYSVAFSPDGKYLASGSDDTMVKLWIVESWEEVTTLQGHNSSVFSVAFSSDGKYLASGSGD
jgi:WD40 repeat protein